MLIDDTILNVYRFKDMIYELDLQEFCSGFSKILGFES